MGNICSCLRSNYYLAYFKQNINKEQFYGNKTDIRKRKIIDSYNISKKYKTNKSSLDDVAIGARSGDKKSKTYDSYLDRVRKSSNGRSYLIKSDDSYDNVYAYPNPVRQGYTGIITITGLVENTQVKITDINGNLICETVSNGSIATWDGKDVHGKKVRTGIYLAICVNADGTQNTITKIMVIN